MLTFNPGMPDLERWLQKHEVRRLRDVGRMNWIVVGNVSPVVIFNLR